MKRAFLAAFLAAAAAATMAVAGSWSVTYPLAGGGTVGLTNTQANSSWVPVSILWAYAAPGTGTTEVWRVSGGQEYRLGRCVFTNVTTVVWVPEAPYPFALGEALVLKSSLTNGTMQVIRRGD